MKKRHNTYPRVVCLALALGLGGCMNFPRNGQRLDEPGQSFDFSGFVSHSNDEVEFQRYRYDTGQWTSGPTTSSQAGAVTDQANMKWYSFNRSVNVPYGSYTSQRRYWRADGYRSGSNAQRRTRAKVRGKSYSDGTLTSFDAGDATDTCMSEQSTGIGVIQQCGSAASPAATIEALCGREGQVCCYSQDASNRRACNEGHRCNTSTNRCTIPSGALLQKCHGDDTCSGDLVCATAADVCGTIVENAPALQVVLRTHTTNGTSAATNGAISVKLKDLEFYLDAPGDDFDRNETNTFGVVAPDVFQIKDIKHLVLKNHSNDGWQFDRITLEVNGHVMFDKNVGATWIDGDGASDVFTISGYELRNSSRWSDPTGKCDMPRALEGQAIQRALEGLIGDQVIARQGNVRWGDTGKVRVGRVDSTTLDIYTKVQVHIGGLWGNLSMNTKVRYECEEDWISCSGGTGEAGSCEYGTKMSDGSRPGGLRIIPDPSPTFESGGVLKLLDWLLWGVVDDLGETVSDALVKAVSLLGARDLGESALNIRLIDAPVCLDVTTRDDGGLDIDYDVELERLPEPFKPDGYQGDIVIDLADTAEILGIPLFCAFP